MTREPGWNLLDTKKSKTSRLGSTGIRRTGEVALFATQPGWLMTREPGWNLLDIKKSKISRLWLKKFLSL
ncbi:hypothetical protein KQ939_01230 [Planococcus sp. CP5-4]|uniref:hypothetical protein n=1 Tax=Planococcus sp. CP5-4 TaxID=2849036 RepID=UPI001CA5C2B3|nr:hypothetical protein [Planococcus sp. CP5-4]MBU9673491.1 hypothetical protein [Planococcus sp. CP5-4_YE]MBW6062325.1 hypothetical protein [Planococcus sp. CP5-4]